MALVLYDEQGLLTCDEQELAKKVFECASALMGQTDVCAELTVVGPEEIREVNLTTRGVDSVTDVLSFPTLDGVAFPVKNEDFPCDLDPETGELMLGEIMLCESRMREQAKEYGHGDRRELAYLIAHGCMHLYGYDHVTDEERALMREREEEVMNILGTTRNLT